MSVVAPELVTGALIAGKYRIEYMLGRGGMGAVYLATNEDIGRRVAIKVLLEDFAGDETLLRRFRQEARTAAAIGHPGIVDVFDLGTTAEGAPFIVMEALEGMTLGARIARDRRMEVAESLAIIAEALDALAAAHDKGILHRDLKPDNLFMVSRPVACVKILDFGISKLGSDSEEVSMTRTGAIFGTPLYMSAEQARGAKYVTAASDLYSMGAILFQMLAGRTPFVGDSYNELVAAVLNGPITSIGELRKDLPAALVTLIDHMLARDPAQRPSSVRVARTRLLEIGRELAPATVTAEPKPIDENAATLPPELAATASTPSPAQATLGHVEPSAPTAAGTQLRATSFGGDVHGATPAAPRSRAAWLGGGVVIVGGVIAAVFVMQGSSTQDSHVAAAIPDARALVPPPDDATEVVTAVDASEKTVAQTIPNLVTLRLHAMPSQTRWVVDGDAAGDCNPCDVTEILGSKHTISASALGYVPIHKTIVFERTTTLELVLEQPVIGVDAGVHPDARRGINTIDPRNPFTPDQ